MQWECVSACNVSSLVVSSYADEASVDFATWGQSWPSYATIARDSSPRRSLIMLDVKVSLVLQPLRTGVRDDDVATSDDALATLPVDIPPLALRRRL